MRLYKLLGVAKSASKQEIKQAYRKLALLLHPDKHTQSPKQMRDAAAEKFKQISAAHEALTDDRKRAAYDRFHDHHHHHHQSRQSYTTYENQYKKVDTWARRLLGGISQVVTVWIIWEAWYRARCKGQREKLGKKQESEFEELRKKQEGEFEELRRRQERQFKEHGARRQRDLRRCSTWHERAELRVAHERQLEEHRARHQHQLEEHRARHQRECNEQRERHEHERGHKATHSD